MKDRGLLNSQKSITEIYLTANEPQSLMDEFSHSTKILDAEYILVILEEVSKTCENLIAEEQHQLLQVLQKYDYLLDGTLGEFNMAPISLNFIVPGSMPSLILFLDNWISNCTMKLQDTWTFESLKKIILLNGHPQHLQLPRRMEL
jgi:hypothetical protein